MNGTGEIGLGFEIQARLAAVDNYNRWIASRFLPYAGSRLVDLGCALGNITQFFLDRELVLGVDIAPEFVEAIRVRFADRPNFEAVLGDAADPALRGLAGRRIDTVLCANVLEHVEDDAVALQNIAAILQPRGRLLLLVPAHQWLFGTMDEADRHFRRYTRRMLRSRLERAAFEVESLRPMNLVGIAGWLVNGRILRRQLISERHYGLYNRLVPVLARIEDAVPPPLGLSLVCVARKASGIRS